MSLPVKVKETESNVNRPWEVFPSLLLDYTIVLLPCSSDHPLSSNLCSGLAISPGLHFLMHSPRLLKT